MDKESLLKKVQALLKLAENNTNVNEAASAFAKAQRLVQDHNLSMAEVEGFDTEEDIDHGGVVCGGEGKLSSWKKMLASCIAKANSCFTYTSKESKFVNGRRKSISYTKIIGRQSDIQIVNYMFLFMSREIERMCKIAPKPSMTRSHGRIWANSFKIGAVSAIREKIEQEKKEAEKSASTSAIVKVEQRYEDSKNWAYSDKSGLKLHNTSGSSYRKNLGAYGSGYEAGKKIHTRSGLTSTGKKLLGS